MNPLLTQNGWISLALVLLAVVATAGLGIRELRKNRQQYAGAATGVLLLCIFAFMVLFFDQFGTSGRSGPNFIANLVVTILLSLAALGCLALCVLILKDDRMSLMWPKTTAAFSGAVACAFVAATAWLYGSNGTHPALDQLARFIAGACVLLAFLLVATMAVLTITGRSSRRFG